MVPTSQDGSLSNRVTDLEAAVADIRRTINTLLPAPDLVNEAKPPPVALVEEAPAIEVIPLSYDEPEDALPQGVAGRRAVCGFCDGGNPPEETKCMWCGKPMSSAAPLPSRVVR